jgi:hypothetical protein
MLQQLQAFDLKQGLPSIIRLESDATQQDYSLAYPTLSPREITRSNLPGATAVAS